LSTLTLVRHAQAASAGDDGLSELGRKQARALAEWWIHKGIQFDEVYSGTLARQIETEHCVASHLAATGRRWPVSQPRPGWNEYDADGVLHRLVAPFAARDVRIADLVRGYEQANADERPKAFQKMFEAAMRCWLDHEMPPGIEPWPSFRDRIREELARIIRDGGGGRRVVVFTSGGPVGVAVQTALAAPDRSFLEVNWRVRNCSVSDFVFGGGRLTLDVFNSLAHLEVGLQSWR
jgi:broad specificity phosphatase PhoE